jgi:hypothetical protein
MPHLLALFLTLSFLAQAETATVEGVVVKQGTSDPVQGAVVTFTPVTGSGRTATSGEDGKFTIANLPAGRYSLTSTRTGFVKARRAGGPANLTLAAGQRLADVRIQLTPTAVITGRVLDENGLPKSNVSVSALRPEYQNGRPTLPCYAAGNARATTNRSGEYRIFGLEPGEYYVGATVSGLLCTDAYYPYANDPADAVLVMARSAVELGGIDIRYKPSPGYSVRFKPEFPAPPPGAVFSQNVQVVRLSRNGIATSQPLGGARLGTEPRPNQSEFMSVKLLPGSYELYYDSGLGVQIGHLKFTIVDRDVDAGTLVIKPGVALGGQIRAPGGLPAGWSFNRSRVVLRPMDARDRNMTLRLSTLNTAATDGTFLLAFAPNTGSAERPGTVAEGRYLVSLSGLVEDQYLASARFKGAEVIDSGVVIDGSDPGPLELTIQNGGSLEGTVRNAKDEPVPDSRVVIVPAPNRRGNLNLYRTVFSDQYGRFSIRGVPPGEYGVLAFEDIENGAWESAEFLREYESLVRRLGVSAGFTASANVRVVPAF